MCSLDLSIIIVNWKSQELVRQCLRSIAENVYGVRHEILIVDNASYDGCEQMVKSEFKQAIFIQCTENIGFAGANNRAFALSIGRNVLFLNPDTEIQGRAIQNLISSLESIPNAGMVGACLLNSDFSLQTTCITAAPSILNQTLTSDLVRKLFPKWKMWGMRPLFERCLVPSQVEIISGACMLAKREVIEAVNAFSSDYFMYCEDTDLCIKIAKAGWNLYYVPDARIVHHGGGSSSSRKESDFSSIMMRQSLLHFLELYRGLPYASLYRCSVTIVSVCRLLLLAMAIPIMLHPRGNKFIQRAASKWFRILMWSLGLTRWAKLHSLSTAVSTQ